MNRSPGRDKVTEEQQQLVTIWEMETVPRCSEATLRPIYRKGDKSIYENYRRIALLNVAYKILSYCI